MFWFWLVIALFFCRIVLLYFLLAWVCRTWSLHSSWRESARAQHSLSLHLLSQPTHIPSPTSASILLIILNSYIWQMRLRFPELLCSCSWDVLITSTSFALSLYSWSQPFPFVRNIVLVSLISWLAIAFLTGKLVSRVWSEHVHSISW